MKKLIRAQLKFTKVNGKMMCVLALEFVNVQMVCVMLANGRKIKNTGMA